MTYAVAQSRADRADFHRSERIVTTVGAAGFGAMIGFGVAMALGRADVWAVFLGAALVLGIALYPASANIADANQRRSRGCQIAAQLHIAALLAWPLAMWMGASLYWTAPVLALSSLILLASCWTGPSRVVYRIGVQGVIIAALAAQQATMLVLGA